jgi:predicted TIM-barrel fold metal-dependent hydrolase
MYWDANGVSHAVLVQPSFLGTDNHYLLDVLRRYPRFRGIARGSADKAAVVGIRLDLSSAPHPQLDIEPWPALLKLQVEVQAEARRWPVLLPPLSKAGVQCDRPFRQA